MQRKVNDIHLAAAFRRFIQASDFPCVGAKAALTRRQIEFAFARDIRSNWNDTVLAAEVRRFATAYKASPDLYMSFVILFHCEGVLAEHEFEKHLWQRLQSLADKDTFFGSSHDPRVSSDPTDKTFGFSLGGEAFFVVGLHPGASRPARRFSRAALVFNAHEQFTRLRAIDRYERMRKTIIDRDIALAGSANPMLARHGEASEARQYSGRHVGEEWRCPFVSSGQTDRVSRG